MKAEQGRPGMPPWPNSDLAMGLAVDQFESTSERSKVHADNALASSESVDDLIGAVFAAEHKISPPKFFADKKRPKAKRPKDEEDDDCVNTQQGQRSAGTMLDAVLNGDLDELYETIVDDQLTDCDAHTRDSEVRDPLQLRVCEPANAGPDHCPSGGIRRASGCFDAASGQGGGSSRIRKSKDSTRKGHATAGFSGGRRLRKYTSPAIGEDHAPDKPG